MRMLAASLDLAARYRVEGDEQTAHVELRGFKVATQINLSEAQAQSEAEEVGSGSNLGWQCQCFQPITGPLLKEVGVQLFCKYFGC